MEPTAQRTVQNGPRTSPLILFEYSGMSVFLYAAFYASYLQICHILPYDYGDAPTTLLLQRLLVLFLLVQVMTNWYLVRRHNAVYRLNDGTPQLIQDLVRRGVNPRDVVRTPLMWRFCPFCKKWAPPRSHHCKICDRCILKRDHHCYFTSTCIGFSNQRFFIVMIFYWIGCVTYLPSLYRFLYSHIDDYEVTYTDYILPVAIWRGVFGSMPGVYANIILFLWGSPILFLLAPSLLYEQVMELYNGLTSYEIERGIRLTPTAPRAELVKEIFGQNWWLNFLFPVYFLYGSDGDGKNWKNHRVLEESEVLKTVSSHGHGHGHPHGSPDTRGKSE